MELIQRNAAIALGSLPWFAQRIIAGPAVEVDGNRLFTDVQMMLRLMNTLPGFNYEEQPVPEARKTVDAKARMFGKWYPVSHVEDITITMRDDHIIPARVYQHDHGSAPRLGSVVYYHGGGFVVGSIDSVDTVCRYFAHTLNVTVISVGYRLAPEWRFPTAANDAIDAYRWVRNHPKYGDVVAVAGDSAGGNLSAVVSNETRLDNPPDAQLLFFPVTNVGEDHATYHTFGKGYFLTKRQLDWFRDQYVKPEQVSDPKSSPQLADLGDGTGVAPAHLAIAGFDPLRDEGLEYGEKLKALGVPTTVQLVSGHIHAFINMTAVGTSGAEALAEATQGLRVLLERAQANKKSKAKVNGKAPAAAKPK